MSKIHAWYWALWGIPQILHGEKFLWEICFLVFCFFFLIKIWVTATLSSCLALQFLTRPVLHWIFFCSALLIVWHINLSWIQHFTYPPKLLNRRQSWRIVSIYIRTKFWIQINVVNEVLFVQLRKINYFVLKDKCIASLRWTEIIIGVYSKPLNSGRAITTLTWSKKSTTFSVCLCLA